MAEFTVFYAWQSDTDETANRYLIRDAAKDALTHLARDADLEDSPRLDSDTQQVAGTPELAATIFGKIKKCGLFLCDLTYTSIATSSKDGSEQPCPNPNVLVEFGFALAHVGWDRIICVLNEAHGPAERMIFDIRHRRWPFTYVLPNKPDASSRAAVRDVLAKNLEAGFRLAFQAEHESVLAIKARLDAACMKLLYEHRGHEFFSYDPSQRLWAAVAMQSTFSAISRLLDLGIIFAEFHTQADQHVAFSYKWTYIGRLLLKHLWG